MPSRSSTAPAPRRKRRVAEPRTAELFKKPSQALKFPYQRDDAPYLFDLIGAGEGNRTLVVSLGS